MSVGRMHSLLRRGCSLCQPLVRSLVNPLGGEPLTGEPDAGNPPVRFGGRGNEINRFSLPLYFRPSAFADYFAIGKIGSISTGTVFNFSSALFIGGRIIAYLSRIVLTFS